jgi:hypothetical protein
MHELPSYVGSMATASGCIIGLQKGLPDILPALALLLSVSIRLDFPGKGSIAVSELGRTDTWSG